MNILLLGSGGREHALAWKIAQSSRCSQLYIAPGNPGTATLGTNVALNPLDFPSLETFALAHDIRMMVVGPEDPLVNGIYDYFEQKNLLGQIAVIGPSQTGARLEGSKAFAKAFMQRHHIPTAAYREFSSGQFEAACAYLETLHPPYVLKADGLAAGKGVIIANQISEARMELEQMLLQQKFGKAGSKVVIEEFLKGIEFSVFVLTDGTTYQLLPEAKDYKRIGEGDTGPNTGGMGAVSPVPFVDEALMDKVMERIVKPSIRGLHAEGIAYKGFLYIGLMVVAQEPFVIEYNCRMGDPETEVVMLRLESDLVEHFESLYQGTLSAQQIAIKTESAVTTVLASGGYPGDIQKGFAIEGVREAESAGGVLVFHAGTSRTDGVLKTSGGRVMMVSATAASLAEALNKSKQAARQISFEGKQFRSDIGFEFI